MKTLYPKWMMVLLLIFLVSMIRQVVLNWGLNSKLVWFNGIGALCIGTVLIFIRKHQSR